MHFFRIFPPLNPSFSHSVLGSVVVLPKHSQVLSTTIYSQNKLVVGFLGFSSTSFISMFVFVHVCVFVVDRAGMFLGKR